MSAIVSQITGVSIVYWTVCSRADQRKHQSSASLDFVRGIHQWPVNSRHKGPVTQKMLPFDDVIMMCPCVHFHAHLLFCPHTHILLISKSIVIQRLLAGRCLFLVKLCATHCTSKHSKHHFPCVPLCWNTTFHIYMNDNMRTGELEIAFEFHGK